MMMIAEEEKEGTLRLPSAVTNGFRPALAHPPAPRGAQQYQKLPLQA